VIANTGKNVKLPEAQQASATPPKAVNVTISNDGTIQVDGAAVKREALRQALEAALAQSEEKQVILRGDKDIVYGEAVYVLDQAQLAGAEGFALATTKVKGR
jgi:biopolymer transport protein ExbD